jgi:hypothetical protein
MATHNKRAKYYHRNAKQCRKSSIFVMKFTKSISVTRLNSDQPDLSKGFVVVVIVVVIDSKFCLMNVFFDKME